MPWLAESIARAENLSESDVLLTHQADLSRRNGTSYELIALNSHDIVILISSTTSCTTKGTVMLKSRLNADW